MVATTGLLPIFYLDVSPRVHTFSYCFLSRDIDLNYDIYQYIVFFLSTSCISKSIRDVYCVRILCSHMYDIITSWRYIQMPYYRDPTQMASNAGKADHDHGKNFHADVTEI